jgi:very-short-patch-repair endonuclease
MKASPAPEQALWRLLHGRTLRSYRFLRRCSIGPFEMDFVCPERALIIHLDTEHRAFAGAAEQERIALIVRMGYRVLRLWRKDLLTKPDGVLAEIAKALKERG